jgi:predicted alpha/beta-hydrolase family hydrolase
LLEGVVGGLPRARLHWLETADHGYKVLKRSRTVAMDVFDEMAAEVAAFVAAA